MVAEFQNFSADDLPSLMAFAGDQQHIAALKVRAMKNDPARTLQDMADVRFLLTLPGVDRVEIRDYFDRQGMGDRFDDLQKT